MLASNFIIENLRYHMSLAHGNLYSVWHMATSTLWLLSQFFLHKSHNFKTDTQLTGLHVNCIFSIGLYCCTSIPETTALNTQLFSIPHKPSSLQFPQKWLEQTTVISDVSLLKKKEEINSFIFFTTHPMSCEI